MKAKRAPSNTLMLKSRWFIRAMLVILLFILGVIGFLFLKQQSNIEYIYFVQDNTVWRIGTPPDANPEIYLELGDLSFPHMYRYDDETGQHIYISDVGGSIHRRDMQTNEDELLVDCSGIGSWSHCQSFEIHPDGNRIAYVLVYYDPEISPNEPRQIRLANLETQTDTLLVEPPTGVYRIRWADENNIEYTTGSREWWIYDIGTGNFTQVGYDSRRIYSPDGRYYAEWSSYQAGCCRTRNRYQFYYANGETIHDVARSVESQASSNTIYWRPDSRGVLYHALFTEIGMPISRLDYYDLVGNEDRTIFEVARDRGDRTEFFSATWSPSGQYILIRTSAGIFIYDMQTANSHQVFFESGSHIIGWEFTSSSDDSNWLSFPEG